MFEKAAEFYGFLLKFWLVSKSSFIKHTILGT